MTAKHPLLADVTARANRILKAIDDEHRDNCRAAQAIYDDRMKAPRAKMEQARTVFERAKAEFTREEQKHERERRDNLAEAKQRRADLRAAVTGIRKPSTNHSIKVNRIQTMAGAKVSLPLVRIVHDARVS